MRLFIIVSMVVAVLGAAFVVAQGLAAREPAEARVFEVCQAEIKQRVPDSFLTFSGLPGSKDYLAPGHIEGGRLWFSSFTVQDAYGVSVTHKFTCEVKRGEVEVYLFSN